MKYDKIDKRIYINQKLLQWLHNSLHIRLYTLIYALFGNNIKYIQVIKSCEGSGTDVFL